MTKPTWEELKQEALVEALEYYIYQLKKEICYDEYRLANQAAIQLFNKVLEEVKSQNQ